jgi:16S rRNA (adenine1518-N6/adenine1519-N6)-dimethyltransferase
MYSRPNKRLGQHFLVDASIARRIVNTLDPQARAPIVEIGPGRGILTDRLAGLGRPLIAVEKDDRLARFLTERYKGRKHVRIFAGDILTCDIRSMAGEITSAGISLVGNIPFQITSPLLGILIDNRDIIHDGVLMIQREVAERLLASPGNRTYGRLTVVLRYFSTIESLFRVGRRSFSPVPEVDATVMRIIPDGPYPGTVASDELFFIEVVRSLFGWRRKQVRKILRKHPMFDLSESQCLLIAERTGVHLSSRPEDLSTVDFVNLANGIFALKGGHSCAH